MSPIRRRSIRTKLTVLSVLATFVPVGGVLAIVALNDIRNIRSENLAVSMLIGSIVATHSAAAMAFDDRPAAEKTVAELAQREKVLGAALYDVHGRPFASYSNPKGIAAQLHDRLMPTEPAVRLESDYIDVLQPIDYAGVRYGTLELMTSTAPLKAHVRAYTIGLGLLVLATLVAALLLAFTLERVVSRPLSGLAQVARRIAERADYSVRATGAGSDEMGLLAEAFNHMLAEIAKRETQAQEAIRVRDDFLSIASHELKTPLTSLQLQLGMLNTPAPTPAEEEAKQKKSLSVIGRQVKRLDALVGNLLDVSRIATKRLLLDLADVDLSVIAREAADSFAAELKRHHCALELHADEPVIGRWDAVRIEQVVTNLISNAIKYGPGKPIQMRVEGDGARARLTVIDHGLGIAPEDLERIFGRFERAVSINYGGLGLGLYISREIVGAHGGVIRAQSELGVGSTFTVELPCAGPPPVVNPVCVERAA